MPTRSPHTLFPFPPARGVNLTPVHIFAGARVVGSDSAVSYGDGVYNAASMCGFMNESSDPNWRFASHGHIFHDVRPLTLSTFPCRICPPFLVEAFRRQGEQTTHYGPDFPRKKPKYACPPLWDSASPFEHAHCGVDVTPPKVQEAMQAVYRTCKALPTPVFLRPPGEPGPS